MENKIESIGCQNYYLYYSRKHGEYKITKSSLEAFDNPPWINLRDEKVSDLIKLLQNHELTLENNKANLSAQESQTIKVGESNQGENKSYLMNLLDIARDKSEKA